MHGVNEIEEILNRELHEVADGLRVPPLPVLSQDTRRRPWLPVLAAAAVLLIVVGTMVVLQRARQADDPPQPMPAPGPTQIPTTPPTVPYQHDGVLYVDGAQVEGTWGYLSTGGDVWLAMDAEDGTWWWGTGPQKYRIETTVDSPPVLSPGGTYFAVLTDDRDGAVTVYDTFQYQQLGSVDVELGSQADGTAVHVRAVTDDGGVVVQGSETSMWFSGGDRPVDLTETAPGVYVHENTAAGLWVSDGEEGEPYLAEISAAGEITRTGDLPGLDDLTVSPGGESMVWAPLGSLGGEAFYLDDLEAGSVDGTHAVTLTAPGTWSFYVGRSFWEDDDLVVTSLVPGEDPTKPWPMARCRVSTGRCVLIDVP